MAAKRDYYEVLGLARDADDDAVKSAYRRLAKQFHPDRNPGDPEAEMKFKEAAEAYEILSDPTKRQRYDRFGHAGVEGGGHDFHNAEDIMSAFSEIFGGGLFGDFFGRAGGGSRSRGPRRGADIAATVTVTLEEVAKGVNKVIPVKRHDPCGECRGTGARKGTTPARCTYCGGNGQVFAQRGFFQVASTCPSCRGEGVKVADPCPSCRGAGRVASSAEIEIPIPAGVDTGMRLQVRGQGEAGDPGAPRGSLVVQIQVAPHSLFERRGNDLIASIPIGFAQAALGGEIEVPTLEGTRERITIARGTQFGDVHRLRGRGLPEVNGRARGDLLVELIIEVPRELAPRQEQLLRELAELDHEHVTPRRRSFLERVRDFFAPDDDEDGAGAADTEATKGGQHS